ncbi:hypothetical protein [Halocatena marina]|uniref:Uncharacterized protein n=1 Tax=Halocatena marina TaxID=2934937 RepID=A0ABD5YPN5_9EURY|nr:hypothetical protein [Halocatena marina]
MDLPEYQWDRITAFFVGVGLAVCLVVFGPQFPENLTVPLSLLPVGFLLYGVTEQTWQTTVKTVLGVGFGIWVGKYAESIGLLHLI